MSSKGIGTVYLRGATYWIKYYKDAKPFYESARTDEMMFAKKLLATRTGEIAQGKTPGIHFE